MKKSKIHLTIAMLEWLSVKILPIVFWISLIFGFDAPYMAILTIISAFIHELGHLSAIRMQSKGVAKARGHITGFRIKKDSGQSYASSVKALAMGPIFNIAVFTLCLPFSSALNGYIRVFGLINLATGVSNLIPIEGYDGFGIIKELMEERGLVLGIKLLSSTSLLIMIALSFLSLYMIDKFNAGYWIFGIFFIGTVSKLAKLNKTNNFEE